MKPVLSRAATTVRCAIYTRKSSEEGLEQDFNSLDAQREACSAYILSQASEGWLLSGERYDDGGISGGTLARPALQRLLADVAGGEIDIIVVYKVDRLTRSLLDFSKLVEAFDAAGTSFVSVTQSFNTTTSMGRLTLNMLLSFAQFEREVTAERIRDKIAASKARGMWMGGTPPLGYAPDGRSLRIVEEHAAIIRHIYTRYLALGSVRSLSEELEQRGIRAPVRTTLGGKAFGGVRFSRGNLYSILRCATYVGEIHHQERVHAGLHAPIIPRNVWDAVQAKLTDNRQGEQRRGGRAAASLLAGRVVDAQGQPLVATHAARGKARYRYYVSRHLQTGSSDTGLRIPATELEAAVTRRIAELFADPVELAAAAQLELTPDSFAAAAAKADAIASGTPAILKNTARSILTSVQIHDGRIDLVCDAAAIAAVLQLAGTTTAETITIRSEVRLTRSGRVMRLVHASGSGVTATANGSLVRLILRARRWWSILKAGELDVTTLAASENVQAGYVTRVLRLAFLAPAVVEAILVGNIRTGVDGATLTATGAVPALWAEQVAVLLPEQR
ncbi:recombinase family protein [Microvirga sp. SRT01]|uniref:Recombinase family protein n=1 Tax=Sphingomonas longa TaxID=2778730 RepID=A0ABS2D9Z7_9SPHN|nr:MULTISPECIES: recombinase family protein [Alphaproteobacteria]MBM6577761.1 recombinase family protein [Sphingomonas sp. BT552]MBR7710803.1 recombinase family protein [Microvirga sp. SRT01]